MKRKSLKEKRELVIEFLRKNKSATTREIRKLTKVRIERTFKYGIKEAYKLADVTLPQHLKRRSKEECKILIINYIKNNKIATISDIQNELGVNVNRLFGGIKQAFETAHIDYPNEKRLEIYLNNLPKSLSTEIKRIEPKSVYRKIRNIKNRKMYIADKKRKLIIETLKKNPLYSQTDLDKMFSTNIAQLFGSFRNLCKLSNVEFLRLQKRKLKKQQQIIDYIRKNPDATQWEINRHCKTHVQELFDDGIREAFLNARIEYPESRRILYGTAKLSIRKRSLIFQNRVVNLLRKFGNVDTQVRTKNGIVDAILNYKNNILPIEIKDYRTKPISESEIRQLVKYLNDLKCQKGLIVSSKGEIKEFNSERKRIIVIPAKELNGYLGS